jgi:site-specific DNA-methyltransferase (adenine-specific)
LGQGLSIYYQDDFVTLYHGDCFDVMAEMPDESIDCVITDPPYTDFVHQNSMSNRSGKPAKEIDFESFTNEKLYKAFDEMSRLTKTWVVSTLDHRHAFKFETEAPNGLVLKRVGVWVKNNPMPQLTADRPAHGWEAIAYLHKANKPSTWNAGGSHGNYVSNLATPTGHPTPKPIAMVSNFVERFSNVGNLILDPFAGGGTTLLAARNLGRKAIGIEYEEKYCELIAKRLSQQTFTFTATASNAVEKKEPVTLFND